MSDQPASRPSRLATALSLLLVGLGHFYVGQVKRGVAWAVGASAAILGATLLGLTVHASSFIYWLGAAVIGIRIGAVLDLRRLPAGSIAKAKLGGVLGAATALFVVSRVDAWILRTFLVFALRVPQLGMLPTIHPADHLFVDMRAFRSADPTPGDLVLFESPDKPGVLFLQRLIGGPGDKIEQRDGALLVNGSPIKRCRLGSVTVSGETHQAFAEKLGDRVYFIFDDGEDDREPGTKPGSWTVPPHEYFTVGDNRSHSYDSRSVAGKSWAPRSSLRGRPLLIWWSFDKHSGIDAKRVGANMDEPDALWWMPLEGEVARCKRELM